MLVQLNHKHLGDLDQGSAGIIIDAAIRDAITDLEDRGKDGKPRKVVIELEMSLGERDDVVVTHVSAGAKIPPRRTAAHMGKIKQTEGSMRLLFQEFAPDDPNQRTIDERLAEGPASANP